MARKKKAPNGVAPDVMLDRLREKFPNAKYELNWETPEQLLVATILAAQCTDERVNKATAEVFPRYPDPASLAAAPVAELEELLRITGSYKNKTRMVQATCAALVARFNSVVPRTVEELCTLPGVARKTANVVLSNAFNIPSGIIVDTHVVRLSHRMGLSTRETPDEIEEDLMPMIPQDQWTFFGPALILHGRYHCTAKKPACAGCLFEDVCPRIGVDKESD